MAMGSGPWQFGRLIPPARFVTTEPTPESFPLAADFPAATREDWVKLVAAALKGAPFESKLVSRTYDGLRIEPLYGRDPDARPIPGRALGRPWQGLARVDHPGATG